MKFGVMVLLGVRGTVTSSDVYARAIAQAEVADELGFDGFWIAEHHFTDYGTVPTPAMLGAAIATRTSRIRIGSAISVLPFHDPRRVAEDYAMLDVLSNGRLDFGVGRGYQPAEFAAMGIPMEESRERFAESLQIIQGLWSQDDFSYQGRFFEVNNLSLYPKPIQSPPPIWMAAVSPDSYKLAGSQGMRVLASPQITPLSIVRECHAVYHDALAEAGYNPDDYPVLQSRQVFCHVSAEAAYANPRDSVMWFQRLNADRMTSKTGETAKSYEFYQRAQQKLAASEYEDFMSSGALLFGTPDLLISEIKRLRDEVGLTYLLGVTDFVGINTDRTIDSMRLFAKEVMPAFEEE